MFLEMIYGSNADIRYGTKAVESTEISNYVIELCSDLVEVYGDMFFLIGNRIRKRKY